MRFPKKILSLPLLAIPSPRLNLLPDCARAKKNTRRQLIVLVITQAAIIICLVLVTNGINNLGRHAEETSQRLAREIDMLRQDPSLATIETTIMLLQQRAAEDAFFEQHAPSNFDIQWLAAVLTAGTGQLVSLSYDGTSILLSGEAYCFTEMESLRQALEDAGAFGYVGLGRIQSQGADIIQFELILVNHN